MTAKARLYRVSFQNQGQVYELYCKRVSHGGLLGFVELEDLVFGEKTSVVLDPGEEKLKTEFGNVSRTYIPVHQVIRVDEVNKPGLARIHAIATDPAATPSKVTPFPVFTPGSGYKK